MPHPPILFVYVDTVTVADYSENALACSEFGDFVDFDHVNAVAITTRNTLATAMKLHFELGYG